MKVAILILIIIIDLNWLYIHFNICICFHSGSTINDFTRYYHTEWSNGTIPPKLHMLEDHAKDFVKKWMTRFGIYMVSRMGCRFTLSLINSKLHIVGCSLLLYVLKTCYKIILDASIQKVKQLNAKINFAEKGIPTWLAIKQLASCS